MTCRKPGLRPARQLVADLLARASSLLVHDKPNSSSLASLRPGRRPDQVCDLDSVMEFGFYTTACTTVQAMIK